MPIVRKGHNFACGNCKRKIKYGEEYYTNDGDIFGYCFNCFVNPSGSEPTEPAEVAPRNKWNNYNKEKVAEIVHSIWLTLNKNCSERGANASKASNSSPSLLILNLESNELITKVKWRKPEVKPVVDSIKHYFINNFETNAGQVLPNKYNPNGGYKPMKHSDKNIWRHLETAINPTFNNPLAYGAYEKNKDDQGKWICFDFDEKNDTRGSNKRYAYEIIGYFESKDISPMLENASEGIESYHVWIFCEGTDIRTLKTIGVSAREACNINSKECEVFPKSNTTGNSYGNLVRIPFGLNRKRKKKSIILEYDKAIARSLYDGKALLP